MYEAMVYSNVDEPMMGNKFGQVGVTSPVDGYRYGLDTDGMLVIDTTDTNAANRPQVGSSEFNQSAGVKTFPKDLNEIARMIPGTYHGVSGTYACTPSGITVCASNVADEGFPAWHGGFGKGQHVHTKQHRLDLQAEQSLR